MSLRRFRVLGWLIVLALTLASIGVWIAVVGAGTSPGKARVALPLAQLVALATDSASGLGDPSVETALVVATSKHAAENWLEPGAISPGSSNPRAYLIVLSGRFVCTNCSYPPGAKAPRGGWAQSIWVPGQGVSDFGLTQRLPGGLDKLGPVVKINLGDR
jgi:hypothetical protein